VGVGNPTHTYKNDPLLHQFIHATPNQVINMWHRIHTELDSFGSELVERRLANKMTRIVLDFQFTRRIWRVYELGIGNWVGNTVIDVFA
jgi:hypothetical protein